MTLRKEAGKSAFLSTPIEYLKGVGPQRAETLRKELRIDVYEDLLQLFPFRYIDRTRFYKIRELKGDLPYVQLKGRITSMETVPQKHGKRLVAHFEDETGSVELVWFQGVKWVSQSLLLNQAYVLFGKPVVYKQSVNIPHPELESMEDYEKSLSYALQAVYPSTEKLKRKGLDSRGLWKLQKTLLEAAQGQIPENLPASILHKYDFPAREKALLDIHLPSDIERLRQAQNRLKFEEFFFIQLRLLGKKMSREQKNRGFIFAKVGQYFHSFYREHLPFSLTDAQKRVIREIRKDLGSGRQMSRLLQGDVGSGKTMVALLCMLIAIDNGYQAAIMAPTEILAMQHAQTLERMLKGLDIRVGLLTGSTKSAGRKKLLAAISEGDIPVVVGTHALLEDTVVFRQLGLVVIDEQHRFGVAQRARFWKKSPQPPHTLVMTATPIPRTLAMTLYGDLDTSVIDELPPGRKSVKTIHRYDSHRLAVFGFMKKEIARGRQVYVVYPLIRESEKLDYKDLQDGFESIQKAFPAPDYRVSIVHGKMKPNDKEMEMERFVSGKTHIMVATTVIEVGVDVPNASVMVIESAERFGLSQLHQLRGRVGRGAEQSYCILMTGEQLSAEAKTRIKTMTSTQDGFRVAEVDLELRGPGDLTGTRQSGMIELKIADLARDQAILQHARDWAGKILKNDPQLTDPAHQDTLTEMKRLEKKHPDWSRIS